VTAPLLISRSEIDDTQWNKLVEKSSQQVIYGYTWYLDIVSPHWKALVWPSDEEYRIVMPLPVKQKWLMEVIQQPLFCQYLGLFSLEEISEIHFKGFLKVLSLHYSYISSYSFHPENSALLKSVLMNFPLFKTTQNTTFWLSLADSYWQINAGFTVDRKNNIKRAANENWQIEKSDDPKELIELFKNNHVTQISGGVDANAWVMFEKLYEVIKNEAVAELWYAMKNNEIHAGVLFVKTGQQVIYLFNAADGEGRKGNARTFLLNAYFQQNAEREVVFDFESPEIKSIASFYKSFGSDTKPYYIVRKNDLPFPFRQIQNWRIKKLVSTRQAPFEDS